MSIATDNKLFRVGSASVKKHRPLKILFRSSNDANSLVNDFNLAIRSGHKVHGKIRIGRGRTSLVHEVLRAIYAELNQRKQAGDSNLVAYIHGIPSSIQKNWVSGIGSSQHPW